MQPEPVTSSPNEGQPNTETDALTADPRLELEDLRHRLSGCEDRATRSAADLDNLQKRFARELARGQAAERRRILAAWIATVDDLERAVAHSDSSDTEDGDGATIDGVRAIAANAVATIAAIGYPRFAAPGDLFDPEIHDVVATVPAGNEAPANRVAAVAKAGYGTVDDLLRPASVVVARETD